MILVLVRNGPVRFIYFTYTKRCSQQPQLYAPELLDMKVKINFEKKM